MMNTNQQNTYPSFFPPVIISGPTASGKTHYSIELACFLREKSYHPIIINFDSLYFYKELNIGTCKPSYEERKSIPHLFIDVASISSPLNASIYYQMVFDVLPTIINEKNILIFVGGSGFYLQAILNGLYPNQTHSCSSLSERTTSSLFNKDDLSKKSSELYEQEGIGPFIQILNEVDPIRMQELHHNDHYRIRRAVEYYWMNGIPFSDGKRSFQNSTDVLSNISSSSSQNIFKNYLRCSLHYYFNIPKEEHWDLIEKRTHQIISNNFQQEVESLIKIFDIRLKPLQSIGYKEMIAYLHHEIKNKEDLINKIIFSTRQLAKSQRTWFKKIEDKITINPTLNSTESFCLQVYLGLQKAKESFPISLSKELCSWIK